MTRSEKPLVVVESGRNGTNANRRVKLMYLPNDLYEDIAKNSRGPLNQVFVELINRSWVRLRRGDKPLIVKTPTV